jgi:hypothetical protein
MHGRCKWVTTLGKTISSIQVSLGTDARITLKWNLDEWDMRVWTALKRLKIFFSGALL